MPVNLNQLLEGCVATDATGIAAHISTRASELGVKLLFDDGQTNRYVPFSKFDGANQSAIKATKQVKQMLMNSAISKVADQFILPAEDLSKFLDLNAITVNEDGTVAGVEEAVNALKTERAYLLKPVPPANPFAAALQNPAAPTGAAPAQNPAAPTQPTQGQPFSFQQNPFQAQGAPGQAAPGQAAPQGAQQNPNPYVNPMFGTGAPGYPPAPQGGGAPQYQAGVFGAALAQEAAKGIASAFSPDHFFGGSESSNQKQ